MARATFSISVRRRPWFWPLFVMLYPLNRVGLLSAEHCGRLLVHLAMKVEVN